ncbi:ATP-binding protein [Sulfurovum sp. NBC37-1]|uniref:ATP-binding protein n=1 Tax=Sulfurovum sp. (strain NBC37-1) TaxID=387093 RepID=UPI00015875AC|nr:ATP-binding protein [Sulfurovum sp. NBC37-1]BAF71825.1 anti-sigma regulatory factor [Sulfurovum sp. NBC37-1]
MNFTSIDAVDRYLEEFCAKHRLSDDLCYKIRLVTEELVTNMFKYTEAKEFSLTIRHSKQIEIDLEYLSDSFDLTVKKPDQKDIAELKEGGLGLFLVESMTETFSYRHQNGKSIYKLTI